MLTDLYTRGHEVYGIDLSAEMVKGAHDFFAQSVQSTNPRIAVADMEHLCFPDGHFDLVVAAGVIEYLPDPRLALSEISRVLRTGGIAIFSIRNLFSLGKPLLAVRDLLSQYPIIGSAMSRGMSFLRFLLNRKPDRKHVFARYDVPWQFRKIMREFGLHTLKQAFYHFSIVPWVVERKYPKPCIKIGVKLEGLSRTPLGYLGRGCIFMARKI